jgi:hypothetical protein
VPLPKTILAAAFVWAICAQAQEFKCPANHGNSALVSADIYDGPPAENAELRPDVSKGKTTYTYASWDVGYLFGIGRTPYLICRFAGLGDAQAETIKIDRKVRRCVFRAQSRATPAEAICK